MTEEEEGKDLIDLTSDPQDPQPSAEISAPRLPPAPKSNKPTAIIQNVDAYNAMIYDAYVHGEFSTCKSLIGEQLVTFGKRAEFAMYMRGVLDRHEGNLEEAISWFNEAFNVSKDPKYLTELGRCYFLQGNHHEAISYCEKAITQNQKDTKAFFWLAKALFYVRTDLFNTAEKARDILLQAPVVKENAQVLIFLADIYDKLGDYNKVIELLKVAQDREPENLEVLSKLGQAYLNVENEDAAFSSFGVALTYEPTHAKSLLGAASIIQKHGDSDVALIKYRTAIQNCDYSAELWNNLGLAYLSRSKLAAAHSLLKRAAFIKPLSFEIKYNLGLCHLSMGLNCSALHFLRAAATLRKDDPRIMGAMAMALSNMKDPTNAKKAYEKAIELGTSQDRLGLNILLNYAMFEYKRKEYTVARELVEAFSQLANKTGKTELISRASSLLRAIVEKTKNQAESLQSPPVYDETEQ